MIDLKTIIGFLLMDQRAIRVVALSRSATLVGFLFVISAGFAREYDGEYLVAEPWHLILPLAASLFGCFLLSVLLCLLGLRAREDRVGFLNTFRSFLNVYWMTAPLAWLYAIPVERLLSPGNATRANLFLLAVVATWRVALMVRSVSVLYRCSLVVATMPVMLFSVALALAALWLVPGPIFMIMGGVRLTESESMIQATRFWLGGLSILSLPVWLIGYLVVVASKNKLQVRLVNGKLPLSGVSRSTWQLALASLVIWLPILPFTQPEQQNRHHAEALLRQSNFEELSKWMTDKDRSDFPPHWDPPPRISYGERNPTLLDAAIELREFNAPRWFVQAFDDKFVGSASHFGLRFAGLEPSQLSDEDLARLISLLRQVEFGPDVARVTESSVTLLLEANGAAEEAISPKRRELLEQLRNLAKPRDDAE